MQTCRVSQNKSNIQYISVSKLSTGYVRHSCEGQWNCSEMLYIYIYIYIYLFIYLFIYILHMDQNSNTMNCVQAENDKLYVVEVAM